jgi:hypothetical protein
LTCDSLRIAHTYALTTGQGFSAKYNDSISDLYRIFFARSAS